MSKEFISGTSEAINRSDCQVRYTAADSGKLTVEVASKVAALYGNAIEEQVHGTLSGLGISHGKLRIDDGGALPFVIGARVEAAVKAAHPDLTAEALPDIQEHAVYASARNRFRRSRIYVPGVQPKLMLNVGIHQPDGVILDLEDSVAPVEKPSARLIVRNALRVLDFFGAEHMVRINQGDLGLADLESIVPQPVHLILIPKVETADQVVAVDEKIAAICHDCGRQEPVYLMPILESALGVLNALEIAQASP
ncbi:MAG: citrate lyase ACP, partial [Candidatus Marinimicrobia bacterium]|nr:citrate lyase ACP [Candidatus Neomarinimicrobiota bacterium]